MWFTYNNTGLYPLAKYGRLDKRTNIIIDEAQLEILIHPFYPFLKYNESYVIPRILNLF
eukprot:UN10053